jgi:hypothetical protein
LDFHCNSYAYDDSHIQPVHDSYPFAFPDKFKDTDRNANIYRHGFSNPHRDLHPKLYSHSHGDEYDDANAHSDAHCFSILHADVYPVRDSDAYLYLHTDPDPHPDASSDRNINRYRNPH